LQSFDKIDFKSIKIWPDFIHGTPPTVKINIGDICIHFGHHHWSTDETPTKKGYNDIYYRHIYGLVYSNWFKRVSRMPNERPCFLLWQDSEMVEQQCIERFFEIPNIKIYMILSDNNIYKNVQSRQTDSIMVTFNEIKPCGEVYDTHWPKIQEFFGLTI
jgi:hypothetical protein